MVNRRIKGVILGKGINDSGYRVTKYEDILDDKGNKVYYSCGKVTKKRLVWQCPYYRRWKNMLERCFCPKFRNRHPTYEYCGVHEDWLYFSKFKAWMEKQDWKGKVMDKDILTTQNKTYSEDTCIFIDGRINLFITERDSRRGVLPIGVVLCKHSKINPYRAVCNNPFTNKAEYLGFYNDPLEAHEQWRKFKIKCVHTMLSEGWIDNRIHEALLNKYTFYKHLV